MLGIGLPDRAMRAERQRIAAVDAWQVAVVRKHMGASAEFSDEGLRVREGHAALRGMADVGNRQMRGRTFRFEEAHQRAVGGGGRLADQRNIGALVERDAPAVM